MTANTDNSPPASTPQLAIAAIFRNERPYVLEWLAHHRLLGVSAFYIADNVSDDGTSELLTALDALGYIKRIPFPSAPGQAPQLPAYMEMLGRHASHEEWVALIDADEFIMPDDPFAGIAPHLGRLAAIPDAGAVALNWVVYGSAGQMTQQPGLLLERFNKHAAPDFWVNHHYKSVVRMSAFQSTHGNPHLFVLRPGYRYVHADGTTVVDHEKRGAGLSQQLIWQPVRLNHYVIKSHEEFKDKQRKGSAAVFGRVKGNDYFKAHDRNELTQDIDPAWIQTVKAEVQRLEEELADTGKKLPVRQTGSVPPPMAFKGVRGHVDRIDKHDGVIKIWGWTLTDSGDAAQCIVVYVGEQSHTFTQYVRQARSDVQRHYPGATAMTGFHLTVAHTEEKIAGRELRVFAGKNIEALEELRLSASNGIKAKQS